jgi:hypothetical protein
MKDLFKLFDIEEKSETVSTEDGELNIEDIENVAGGAKGPSHQRGK